MPSSTIFHAAVFIAGAAFGVTAATAANSRRERFDSTVKPPKPSYPNNSSGTRYGPAAMVEMGPKGVPTLVQQHLGSDVLKYGHPGMFI
jgi:hypothetical protein